MPEQQSRRSFTATDRQGRLWSMPAAYLALAAIGVDGDTVHVAFPAYTMAFGRPDEAGARALAAELARFAGDEDAARRFEEPPA
jgi:hypothetical protein